jgi:hypothetical protein
MNTTKVKCNCANQYQDKKYGQGIRVANLTQKVVASKPVYRCTVCSTLHS